ncbi:hypothetical protein [Pseudomonas phage vB_PsaM_M1]|nr:hypothetical protein [Pseudomonas phage vB_PsaM_M1]
MKTSAFTKNDKVWQNMKKNLIKGESLASKIGVFDKYYGEENDNLPVAQVFQWNEEGSETNPMRPAIRYFIMQLEKEGKFIPFVSKYLNSVAMGSMTWTQLYEKIGEAAAKDLKEVVDQWEIPPNSETTIAEKGRNDPLVDTGTMRDSIENKIGRKAD